MRFIIGAVLLKATFIYAVILTGGGAFNSLACVIDGATLTFALLINFSVLVGTGQVKLFVRATNALLSKKYVLSTDDRLKAVEVFALMIKVTIYGGVLSAFIGLIMILGNLDDLNYLGPMLSVMMISVLYAAFINLIFFLPGKYLLENRKNPDEKPVINEKAVVGKLLELCYKQGISPEEILEANEITFKN
ncbi:MAG: hypothetical protein LBI27_08385 [Clostridiales bacterium]|jgi:flagellar motor component MotA|nr:hypothetical protein [Clostridiales bacterium]